MAAVAIGCAIAGAGCGRSAEPRRHARANPAPPTGFTAVEGLTYSEFEGEVLRRRLRADALAVVPKRIGLFQVGPVAEVVLTRARLEVFEEAPLAGGAARGRSGASGVDALVRGPIAGAKFLGLDVLFSRHGDPLARIRAEQGTVTGRRGAVALAGFEAEHLPTRRVVRARRAVWDGSNIRIAGEYTIVDGAARSSGTGIEIDLDFRRTGP